MDETVSGKYIYSLLFARAQESGVPDDVGKHYGSESPAFRHDKKLTV
jgi:hypothetical protein